MSAPRPGDLLGARYVLVDVLGEGSSAVVYRARDRWRDAPVAVKVFRGGGDAERVESARREHALARDLGHPALASALDAGRFGAFPFLVLELAAGEPLDVALRGADPRQIAQVIDGVASALAALHARGLVHGDLKPANVRVARRDQQLAARLIDLGCARASGTLGGGTAAYAAPEAIGGAVTNASDLFSLGVIAWEALTGELPFGDPRDAGYLTRLAQAQASHGAERVPAALAPILARLLSAAPAARHRSAGELRAALREVAELPELDEAPAAPALLEREALLDALRAHALDVARGGASPLRLVAAPRAGATRALTLAAAEARIDGMATIELSAKSALNEWLHALVDAAARHGAPHADDARRAIEEAGATPERRHAPLLATLRVLSLASEVTPLVVYVDDADHAPAPVADAIRFLSAARTDARLGWVIGGASGPGRRVRLEPLSEPSVAALIASLLPGVDGVAELARIAMAKTEGIAGRVVEGALALAHTGAVRFVAGQWRRSAEGLPADAFERIDGARLERHLERLSPEQRTALAAIALDGGTPTAAGARLGLAEETVARVSALAVRAGILRRGPAGPELASREIRERLVASLDADARASLRRRALDALDGATDLASRAARARHLAALGRLEEAAQEAFDAGEATAASGDPHAAAELFEQAERHGLGARAVACVLALAAVRASLGQTDAALAALERAAVAGAPAETIARIRGRVLARAARYQAAMEALEPLAEAGALEPEDRFWLGWSAMMCGRYDDAALLAAVPASTPTDRARLGRLAGTIAWHRGELDRARAALVEARSAAEEARDPLLLAEVEQSLGTAERLRGDLEAAGARYASAIAIAREAGFATVLAKALNNLAIVEYQAGRWEAARHAWESMRELATRLEAHEEILLAHNNLGLLFRDRGELARAERSLDEAIAIARLRRLARYEAMALGNRADVRTRALRLHGAELDLDAADEIARRIGAEDELRESARRRAGIRLARGDARGALLEAIDAAQEAARAGARAEAGQAYLVATAAARAIGRVDAADAYLTAAAAAWDGDATRLDLARLDLERARVRLAAGDRREAVRLARRAGAALAELGAEAELAVVREIEDADLSVDRGEALLAILQIAAREQDASALLDQVLGGIVTLTGAERGVIVTFTGDEEPRVAARRGVGDDETIVSRGIADRAIASGRAFVLGDVEDDLDLVSRESVVRLGLRAALCAPLLSDGACLGILYVDSTAGAELVRFGLWVVDAAAAILAPALARLEERDRQQEREALSRAAAIDALETVGAIDAALDLVAESVSTTADAARLQLVRDRCGALLARSERLLELLRVDARARDAAPERLRVRTVVASALEALGAEAPPRLELGAAGVEVFGTLDPLAAAVARMVESAQPSGEAVLRVLETDEAGAATRAWRPGASAGRRFVRFEVEGARPDAFAAEATALPLRAARRIAARCGGRLFAEPTPSGARLVMELEALEARS